MRDALRSPSEQLGAAIKHAAENSMSIELGSGAIEIGCVCASPATNTEAESGSTFTYRMSLMQGLLLLTAMAILLTVFRRPISLLFDERVYYWLIAPWSVYGWLFWGGEIVDPKVYGKDLICVIVFAMSTAAAILLPMGIAAGSIQAFKDLWVMAKAKPVEAPEKSS